MNTKKLIVLIIPFLLMVLIIACQSKQERSEVSETSNSSTAVIEVYDFHVTIRCMTCRSIENNARNTLLQYFTKELDSGLITFQVINIDLPENKTKAEEFQAYGSSLYLRINKNNESEIVNLTDFAFLNAMDDEKFKNELKSKIEVYL